MFSTNLLNMSSQHKKKSHVEAPKVLHEQHSHHVEHKATPHQPHKKEESHHITPKSTTSLVKEELMHSAKKEESHHTPPTPNISESHHADLSKSHEVSHEKHPEVHKKKHEEKELSYTRAPVPNIPGTEKEEVHSQSNNSGENNNNEPPKEKKNEERREPKNNGYNRPNPYFTPYPYPVMYTGPTYSQINGNLRALQTEFQKGQLQQEKEAKNAVVPTTTIYKTKKIKNISTGIPNVSPMGQYGTGYNSPYGTFLQGVSNGSSYGSGGGGMVNVGGGGGGGSNVMSTAVSTPNSNPTPVPSPSQPVEIKIVNKQYGNFTKLPVQQESNPIPVTSTVLPVVLQIDQKTMLQSSRLQSHYKATDSPQIFIRVPTDAELRNPSIYKNDGTYPFVIQVNPSAIDDSEFLRTHYTDSTIPNVYYRVPDSYEISHPSMLSDETYKEFGIIITK